MTNDPGLGELARKFEDFRRDVRDDFEEFRRDVRDDFTQIGNQLAQFVLREVYLADKNALEARLSRMEREQEAQRSAVRAAIYAAVGSVLASIIAGVVLAVLLKGGR